MEVDFTWWGHEAYLLDGQLLHSRWDPSFSGEQEFDIAGRKVRIEGSNYPNNYYHRVFVDDTLHVEELFPEEKAKADKWKRAPYKYWLAFGFMLLCAFAGYGFGAFVDDTVTAYQRYKAEQQPPAGCKYIGCWV
jgi:hypothetical protein